MSVNDVAVEELTVDDLAARVGMTVRTVRFYAGEGLIPAPERRGRVAYYGPQHRMRLELIRELQDHGYTLAAIERVLSRIPSDASAGEFAVQAALFAPWTPDRTEELDRAALERRAGRRLSPSDLAFLMSIGTVTRVAGGRYRTSPSMLGVGVELLDLPVPAAVFTEAAAVIEQHATAVAEGLSDVFRRGVWAPLRRGEVDNEELARVVSRLRPLTIQALVTAFGAAADRASRRPLT